MDYEELLSALGIDGAEELEYFEQFADLAELEDDISCEAIQALAAGMPPGALAELTEAYVEDMLRFVPDEEDELFTLFHTIGTTLASLAGAAGDDEGARLYAEEMYKFRSWYLTDARVLCTDQADGVEREVSLFEALTNVRMQNIGGSDCTYDWAGALDYPLDEYVVSLTHLLEDDYGSGDDDDEVDYHDPDFEGYSDYAEDDGEY